MTRFQRRSSWRAVRTLLLGLALLAGCGTAPAAGPPASGTSIDVHMYGNEFQFTTDQPSFAVTTPYRFIVHNTGVVPHEWVVAPTTEDAAEHAHDAHDAAVSAIDSTDFGPGAEATRTVTFPAPGSYEIACRLPGHYEAGMHLIITVQ